MASMRPLPLLRLNATHAQALRRLGGGLDGVSIKGLLPDAVGLTLRLSPLSLAERDALEGGGLLRMSLEWAGGRLLLDLSEAAAGAWLRAMLGSSAHAALPPGWTEPALALAVERASAALETLGRGPLRLASIAPAGAGGRVEGFHPLWLEAVLGAERVTGLLQLDSLSLLLVSSVMPAPAGSASSAGLRSDLPVPFRLGIGQTRLELAEYRKLRPGGVVFIAEPWSSQPGELILQAPEWAGRGWGLRVLLSATQLNIIERVHLMNAPVQDESSAGDLSESLAQLPVRLSFDLGEKIMTLTELQALDAGSAINLDRPLQDFVTIRVNGQAVGEGQLVDMDGRLGVMVSRLSVGGLG
jgi:type III secretion protein Q